MDFNTAFASGIACAQKKDYQSALSFFSVAHTLQPDNLHAVQNMGAVLSDLAQFDKALPFAKQAANHFDNATTNATYAVCLFRAGQFAEAERLFRRVIAVNAHDAQMHYNLAFCQLAQGNYEEAWKEIRWRKKRSTWGEPIAYCTTWQGQELSAHQTLVVFHEQGFGDTLMLLRYLAFVLERVKNVIVVCPTTLHRIIKSSFSVETKTANDHITADYQCSFFDLPAIFDITLHNIPKLPYLKYPDQIWVSDMPCARKIGLVWAGGAHAGLTDTRRSLDFSLLQPLFDLPDMNFVSLQLGKPNRHSRLCTTHINDFADTAAIIQQLDLVITVDTSVLHLSAGLGKPTWLMNRYDSCWRWLIPQTWYRESELREFRQPSPGDWNSVINQICTEL